MRPILYALAWGLLALLSTPGHAGPVVRQSAPGTSAEYTVTSPNAIAGPVIRSGSQVIMGSLRTSATGYDSFQMYDGVYKIIGGNLVEVDFHTGEPLPKAVAAAPSVEPVRRVTIEYASGRREVVE